MRLLGADVHHHAWAHSAQSSGDRSGKWKYCFDATVLGKYDEDAYPGTSDVLLMFEIAVHRNKDLKTRIGAAAQKLAILDPRPTDLHNCAHIVAAELGSELTRH